MYPSLPKVIVIVGPTASGKTALAHMLAEKFHGDIITADSRQVYRGADIGTAKPHPQPRHKQQHTRYKHAAWKPCPDIPEMRHYGIDLVNPDQYFSVQQWKRTAENAIREIRVRGRVPIIEGGTWQWIWTFTHNLTIPEVAPDKKLRARLEKKIQKEGVEGLAAAFLKKDPGAAAFLDLKNPRRVIRAWEVMLHTKTPFSKLRRALPPKYRILMLGPFPSQRTLEKNIRVRLRKQMRDGLAEETKKLARSFGWNAPALSSIGYREWRDATKQTAKRIAQKIEADTQELARVQLRMFRKNLKVKWTKNKQDALRRTRKFLAE